MPHVLIIDWANFLHRAYHVPGVQDLNALPDQAAVMLRRVVRIWEPHYLLIAEDHPAPSHRTDLFPAYKQGRNTRPTSQELIQHMRPFADDWGLLCLSQSEQIIQDGSMCERGLEADDVIARVAFQCVAAGSNLSILSRDKDLYALLSPTTRILSPEPGQSEETVVDEEWLLDTHGLTPHQIVDWKILAGDRSDNIPNVGIDRLCKDGQTRRFGFTPTRAAELLRSHGSLQRILEHSPLLPRKEYDWLQKSQNHIELMEKVLPLRTDFDLPELKNPRRSSISRLQLPATRARAA